MQTDPPVPSDDLPRLPSSPRNAVKGCLIALVIALALPVLGLFLLVKIPMWADDGRLDDFTDRFYAYPLPPSTEFADYDAEGSVELRSNGDHCDYLVRFSLTTQLPEEEITKYYKQADIPGVDGERAQVTVYFPKYSSRFDNGWPTSFIVEIFDSTDPGWDIRCH
ncbi:hypothetical protein N5079_10925 [Planotetraspora sp. A-T 1434]|uniref:hypothetical protein n=1 Tax=Planotetraspora sp. A-T 1434 TaxID=2979219 RepID=UPI0021BE74B1|nr:hypothetical protein [Planotetraspora sp. A-T 1434]MCT9930729.1 hypothetical protein [Planotetraspora sp. A-T 1434]